MERLLDPGGRKRSSAANALSVAGATVGVGVLALAVVVLVFGGSTQFSLDTTFSALETAGHTGSKQKPLRIGSLDQLQKTVFFDAVTRKPRVWYAITASGELELFSAPGRNPESGEALKPITLAVVQQLERRLRVQQQEHLAETERRAATDRADAEIARARRAQSSGSATSNAEAVVAAARGSAMREATGSNSADPRASPPSGDRGRSNVPAPFPSPPVSVPPQVASTAPTARTAVRSGSSPEGAESRGRNGIAVDEPYADRGTNDDARRATQYNELVSTARGLIDAGRYKEAQANAQRAIFVDPRRMAARTLWAEAQTKLDESPAAFARPGSRWPY